MRPLLCRTLLVCLEPCLQTNTRLGFKLLSNSLNLIYRSENDETFMNTGLSEARC